MPAAIEARGWGWRYHGRRAWALRRVDLRIAEGERVLLLGASGSGKSTLLAAAAGLLEPTAGDIEGELLIAGRPPSRSRERVGLLFQDPEAQLIMARAGDDVAFGLENRCVAPDAIWPQVDAALAAVGFRYAREHRTGALSGGEQQRLALAGVIALRPSLLLLDEPTANLDIDGAALVREAVRRVVAEPGMTMLLVEHRVAEALPLVDRVVVVAGEAGVVADGPPASVFAEHGAALAAAGVWVPGVPVDPPARRARPPSEPLLVADDIGFTYPASRRPALSRVDLEVRSSEATAVMGPNGSGKSTLALLLAGLLQPSSGSVFATRALADGRSQEPIWRWPARELARSIGTVFQNPEHQFLTRRVIDELTLGPIAAGLDKSEAHLGAAELLERLGLSHLAEANPFTLSGGEKRRLSVATALATAPAVLLLDEPTFGQDRRTWAELLDLLAALRDAGRAICFATHDREFAEALADRVLRLTPAHSG